MPFAVLIYSADSVRGKILEKSFQVRRIPASVCTSQAQLIQAVNSRYFDVLIFDTKHNFWSDLNLFNKFSGILKKTTKIILSTPQNINVLQTANVQHDLSLADPLDPELIVATVQTIVDSKKKTLSAAA